MKRVATLMRRPVIAATDLDFLAAGAHRDSAATAEWLGVTLPEAVEWL